MDTKSLSSRQVKWAQELFWYRFQIDYHQAKANSSADVLSRGPWRSQAEEETLQAEKSRILHCLQAPLTYINLERFSWSGLVPNPEAVSLSPLHQIFIRGTHMLPQLTRFWKTLQSELTHNNDNSDLVGPLASLSIKETLKEEADH